MFNDLLNELKGFKYQITVEVLLKKYKHNGEIEFRPVYFNSVTKTVTNHICFLWCHVRHINPSNEDPERILKNDKRIAEELNYDGIKFPVKEKDFNKIEIKNNICINVFGYENKLVFPI